MKVLVTGACGRVGSHVIRGLIANGFEVVGVDSVISHRNLRDLIDRVPLLPVDVLDLSSLVHLVMREKVWRVVHLAAALGDHYDSHPWISYQVNLGGTLHVLEAARHCGIDRVVMASTRDIYPKAHGVHGPPEWRPVTEEVPPDPHRPYAVMKLASEYMGRIYSERLGVDFGAVRFGNYYGAERAVSHSQRAPDILNRLILDAVEGVRCDVESGGDQVFDPVYIKDCAQGVICACLANGPLRGRVYNIGGGNPVSLFEFAEILRRIISTARLEIGPGLHITPDDRTFFPPLDITRARCEIGYEPQYTLEEGIRDCIRELKGLLEVTESTL